MNIFKQKGYKKRKYEKKKETENSDYLYRCLKDNIKFIEQTLGNSMDVVIHDFLIQKKVPAVLIYTKGLSDKHIQQELLESLMLIRSSENNQESVTDIEKVKRTLLTIGHAEEITTFQDVFEEILSGDTVILIDGNALGVSVRTRGWKSRDVSEPVTQSVVRGPQEGFTETLITNTALIRRKIRDENLWIESKKIGKRTKTDVAIVYIKGLVNESILKEVKKRLDCINIDGILESGYIEELIQDKTLTPFPTIINSERPDTVAANLLEGRVAIVVDGTPFVLILPAVFTQFFHAAEDYYNRSDFGLLRLLRLIAFFISLLAPSLYVAITTFHQEMFQTTLLISLAAQREGVPFPAFIEALLMEFTFEILREAGTRLPRVVGSAISIVGAIVLGEAAYTAGLVSPAMIIVVSITAISSFVVPAFSMSISIRVLRFLMMGLAATFGLYGIIMGLFGLTLHLSSLKSFGVPYMSPLGPGNISDQKDTLVRVPWGSMKNRPQFLNTQDDQRESTNRPQKNS
ncbi:spore germination protein [Pseudalkalibacillus sp. R45]|uniref:spore germination protein n=1 Tax=Pseudalkalibacillus sp. R45 TaxID=3457433 RepID=UPI003FCD8833